LKASKMSKNERPLFCKKNGVIMIVTQKEQK